MELWQRKDWLSIEGERVCGSRTVYVTLPAQAMSVEMVFRDIALVETGVASLQESQSLSGASTSDDKRESVEHPVSS